MEEKKPKQKMNKTWILIGILVIITGALLAFSLTSNNPDIYPTKSSEVIKNDAQTSLSFSDSVRTNAVGAYEVDINLDSGKNEITLVQLEMTYDPDTLSGVDIKPGNFIKEPVIIQKSINTTDGRIKYWVGIKPKQNGVNGKGVIATLSFYKPGAGAAQINFLPKTSINAVGTDESVLKNMVSGFILNFPDQAPPTSTTVAPTPTTPSI